MSTIHRHITEHQGFGFACASIAPTGEPAPHNFRRCGKGAHKIMHIGGNDMQLAYCDECLKYQRIAELLDEANTALEMQEWRS